MFRIPITAADFILKSPKRSRATRVALATAPTPTAETWATTEPLPSEAEDEDDFETIDFVKRFIVDVTSNNRAIFELPTT